MQNWKTKQCFKAEDFNLEKANDERACQAGNKAIVFEINKIVVICYFPLQLLCWKTKENERQSIISTNVLPFLIYKTILREL